MNNNIFKKVGNNIQSILIKSGHSQQYLADELNISKQVMSKIISGEKAINVFEIGQIAKTLNVSVDMLLEMKKEEQAVHNFSFMGRLQSEQTKEKIELLKNVIDEIIMLEDYADDK